MRQATSGETSASGRRIIQRPRLTQLLAESDSRVLLLTAPAGYGKTTLAREWLSTAAKPHGWYQVTEASSDVAALALGVGAAVARVVPDAGEQLRGRLRTSPDPETHPEVLANDLAADLATWPASAWLVIDDYHLLVSSNVADQFVETLLESSPIQLLVATRQRPAWVTAKRLLYGEITELGRTVLAMTHEEAAQTLSERHGEMPGLVALAEGWPAVIGLATLIPDPVGVTLHEVPDALHRYFADELYHGVSADLQWRLVQLSLAPSVMPTLALDLFGSTDALEEGFRRGFLTNEGGYDLHPLLRQFLRSKLADFEEAEVDAAKQTIAAWYVDHECWDEAFEMCGEFQLKEQLVQLINRGLDAILAEGRMPTLKRWVELGWRLCPTDPVVRYAEIECAFREGRWHDSETKALSLSEALPSSHHLSSRVLFRAGQIAQLDDRQKDALELLSRSQLCATNPSDLRRARWSRFVTICELEQEELASAALSAFEQIPPSTAEDLIRISHGRLLRALRWGGILQELDDFEGSLELLSRVADPLARTGFLQSLGSALGLATRYASALDVAERQLAEADRSGLEWVVPHALELKGLAQLGLRSFESALSTLRRSYTLAAAQSNLHSQMSAVALTARIHLARGEPGRALEMLNTDWERAASAGMVGDFLATKALVLGCCRRTSEALELVEASEEKSNQIDARVLSAFARAIIGHEAGSSQASSLTAEAIRQSHSTGNLDGFVTAYRAYPALLAALDELGTREAEVVSRIVIAVDPQLAPKARLGGRAPIRAHADVLTPREHDVFELLRQGMTNREIARSLWIEESTAKVHVRRILQKFGARSRTEAATIGTEILNKQQLRE